MKRCPITYEIIPDNQNYSRDGLRLLSPQLKNLHSLNLTAEEQRQEAIARVGKMSIQGVQTKLSAQLKIKEECFEIVDHYGKFILKPQSEYYPELPENEAISMTLATHIGISVPIHGLIYSKDKKMTYFVKRFDHIGHHKKLAVEDFAQLAQANRYTKYDSSMEKVSEIIKEFCSFPKIELVKLLKLTLFNFLIGNEDMHLKNFSLMTKNQLVTLSPAYDLLNSTIAQSGIKEEIALPLNGKKNNLKKRDFINYFATERLGLNDIVINNIMHEITLAIPIWQTFITHSFLSALMQKKYLDLLAERCARLELPKLILRKYH